MFEWILGIIESYGYAGIFFMMVLENIFPPIPSEVVIPVAGYAAASDGLNLLLVIIVASLGAAAGTLPWYFLGRLFGLERVKKLSASYGRWLTMSPVDVENAENWFVIHGRKAVLYGRLVPTVRSLISIPAGIAKMPLSQFFTYSFIGSLLWTSWLAFLGYFLESQYHLVAAFLNPISNAIVILIVLLYVYRVVMFKKIKNS